VRVDGKSTAICLLGEEEDGSACLYADMVDGDTDMILE
jgi:hypothetical protein